ncbi:helix-turn-helix transcriptional regulator [Streptomyces sp. ICBB 8177]|uniref:helix-turn-helix domain-containing protein n=1 Tax=Streptomyces sp. ICBB 8177 TaxID=563922 RepID=UPI000D676E5A|nr:helix-turn-helix transcriptional regulator [Streptomyces sp. ICBB 8177]PWI44252.1 hypothetical protein CK485_19830 [Streptomyces sp. ICBB 8177]
MPQTPGQGGRNEDPADELVRSFGRRFKIFRERAGLTQAELGEQPGYGEAQIASIEQDRRIARPQTIDRADELLGAGGVLTDRKNAIPARGGGERAEAARNPFASTATRGPAENPLAERRAAATLPEAVRKNEEVVPVNAVSTWVLPSGATVGR